MSITRKESEEFDLPASVMLARLVAGTGIGELVEEKEPKKALTAKIDPEIYATIETFRKKAKTTRTAVVEILLAAGIKAIEEQIERDNEVLGEVAK